MKQLCRVALVLVTFLCSCGKKEEKNGETLHLSFLTEANSLDPRIGYEIPANFTAKMLFEGLYRIDPQKNLSCGVAERYEVSKDRKTYTFYLRPCKWSNGMEVTAQDFEFAWKTVIDPTLPTQGKTDFYPIKNVEAIVKGEKPLASAGIYAIDAKILVVELEHPTPYFLELTTSSVYSPICKEVVLREPAWAENEKSLVCNGPYLLKTWNKSEQMLFQKNPSFWDAHRLKINAIKISIVPDAMTQLALFEKHKTDWFGKPFSKLPLDAVPSLQKKEHLISFPEQAVYWYYLNTKTPPFNNISIRKAFGLAIDRNSLVKHVLKEGELAATSVYRSSHSFFHDGDVEKARFYFQKGLNEMGFTQDQLPQITLSYCGIETNEKIAEAIAQQWRAILGVEVKLDPQEWTIYYQNLCDGNFQIGGLSWHSRVDDALYTLQTFLHENDRMNMSNWQNSKFQALVNSAQQEVDLKLRKNYLLKAESVLLEEMPVIPIYFLTLSYSKNKELKNVLLTDLNQLDFSWAYFERKVAL